MTTEARPSDLDDEVMDQVEKRLLLAVHEIRQPLSAVLALAEAAATVSDEPAVTKVFLEQIVEQVHEASEVANSVLTLPAAAPAPLAPSAVPVSEVVDSVLRSIRIRWKGRLVHEGALDGVTTRGHCGQIRRSVGNVVTNAVRAAGPHGQIRVTERLDGDWIRIIVEDDGPGFGRIPSGSGLGLAVTRANLRAVGGSLSIGVRSSLGGALVVLCLPAQRGTAAPVDEVLTTG
jgi:signal transduction histidine kinase